MSDYEYRVLESKIQQLQRDMDNLEYDVRRLQENKADVSHHHKEYQPRA